jgi:hypothetical protein
MADIVVLTHAHDVFLRRNYLLESLFSHWRQAGHKVGIVRGIKDVEGDLAIQHVDCSVIPDDYRRLAARFSRVINGTPQDVRKRTISRLLIRPDDGWDGPVIAKSDLNFAGIPESIQNSVATARHAVPPHPPMPPNIDYRVYPHISAVPPSIWGDPARVVERFVPEKDERGYWLWTWVFFGDRGRCNRHCSLSPVVKADNTIHREPATVPAEIREERRRLGFDYGKFDFVVHDDRPILLDANRTPGGSTTLTEDYARGAAELAKGIDAFLQPTHAA